MQGPRDSDAEKDDPLGGYCGTEKAVTLRVDDLKEKAKRLFFDTILLNCPTIVEQGDVEFDSDVQINQGRIFAEAMGNGMWALVEEYDTGVHRESVSDMIVGNERIEGWEVITYGRRIDDAAFIAEDRREAIRKGLRV